MSDDVRIITPQEARRYQDRVAARQSRQWIVDRILCAAQVHMITGPSGTGKTSWLLPAVRDWADGKDFLGYKSYPCPYLYVSCDRSFDELDQTLTRLGLEDWDIPALCIDELESRYGFVHGEARLEDLPTLYPWVKFFIIEAIGWFTPGTQKNSGYQDVMRYWSDIRVHFASKGLSILGTTHSAKSKPGENYAGRDKIIGSSGQPAVYSTVITFDFEDSRDPTNPNRLVTIYPRNEPNMVLRYTLDNHGRLEFNRNVEGTQAEETKAFAGFVAELKMFPANRMGDLLTRETLAGIQERLSISPTTRKRMLKILCDLGVLKLIHPQKGTYRIEKDINTCGSLATIQ